MDFRYFVVFLVFFLGFARSDDEPVSCIFNPLDNLVVTCYVENQNITETSHFALGERDRKGNLIEIDNTKVQRVEIRKSNVPKFPVNIFDGFPNLERFYCRGKLQVIESGTFKDKSRLNQLNLNENSLTIIKTGNFEGAENLIDLRLGANQIEIVETDAFLGLLKLQFLRLSENKITNLAPNTFATNTALEKIDLAENHLVTLPPELFKNNLNLKKIKLEENKISILSNTMFSHLKDLDDLELDDNECIDMGFDQDSSEEKDDEFMKRIEIVLEENCSPKKTTVVDESI
jgi:Leucine-rich repeat (LRR) protein